MSVDRTKILEAAQKFLSKGNYDKAIAELRKIVQDDPTDVRTWLKIGDLYTRKGSRKEAIETYAKVAETYGDQGFFLKAVAVYKQILKLDPTRLDIQLRLAEMYEMLQLTSEALGTYEHVAAGYVRGGNIDKALDTLRKMTELDPENIPIRIRAAEGLSKAGRTKEAAEEFEAGAALLKAQGRFDDYVKVAERLLYHRPDDVGAARELAKVYLERSDPKRALSKLQLCFKADPKDIATLELLAEAFNQLGQLPKTLSVYKEVARIHQEANRGEERARILTRILELDPADRESRQALASFAGSGASARRDIQPPPGAVVAPSAAAPALDDDDDDYEPEIVEDVEILEEDAEIEILEEEVAEEDDLLGPAAPSISAASSNVASSGVPSNSIPPDVQREAQIARLLTECDVFLRYGLKQKVIEQLRAVIAIDSLHVEARERLKDIFIDAGRLEEAVIELLALAEVLADEQSAAAALYLRQVLEVDPDNAEALSRLSRMGASIPPPPASHETAAIAPPLDEPAPAAPEAALDAVEDVFFLDEEADDVASRPPSAAFEPPTAQVARGRGAELLALDDDDGGGPKTATDASPLPDDPLDDGLDAPAPPSRRAIVPPPSGGVVVPPPSGARSLAQAPLPGGRAGMRVPGPGAVAPSGDPLAPMTPEEFDDVPLRQSTPGEVRAEASQRLSLPPGEVEEVLDEADFFVAQGLMDEARAMLGEALNNHPGHPLLSEKLREVEGHAARLGATRSAEMDLDQSFELAERLAEEFDDVDDTQAGRDVLDVEEVFAQFKKGVEQQVAMEDSETHFDLGIAYKEMGLLDDAINEFRLCLSNSSRICISETMIGLCCIEKGELTDAISHFKKGLYADSKTDREELGLYFELGRAYDMLHDPKEALYYYQKVEKRDPGFRNVERLIRALAQPHTVEEEAPPAIAQDDIDRAFDDLMGED